MQETWQAMEKLVDEGLVKSIGISNFSVKKIKVRGLSLHLCHSQLAGHAGAQNYLMQALALPFCNVACGVA